MKTIPFLLIFFLAFTSMVSAQEEQDTTQRQPPIVTQTQVEKDAQVAQVERKKHEEKKNKENEKKSDDKKTTPATINQSPAEKTSKKPGKQ